MWLMCLLLFCAKQQNVVCATNEQLVRSGLYPVKSVGNWCVTGVDMVETDTRAVVSAVMIAITIDMVRLMDVRIVNDMLVMAG